MHTRERDPDTTFDPVPLHRPLGIGRLHIDLNADWELLLWTREFGCSAEELRAAVRAVGTRARDVRVWLHTHRAS